MSDPRPAHERIRAVGLFDLQPTLAGLLKAVAAFCEQHRVEPTAFAQRHDAARGWQADIDVSTSDFFRIFADYPVPAQMEPAGTDLLLHADLRAGRVHTRLPLTGLYAQVLSDGLVLRTGGPAETPAPGRSRVEIVRG